MPVVTRGDRRLDIGSDNKFTTGRWPRDGDTPDGAIQNLALLELGRCLFFPLSAAVAAAPSDRLSRSRRWSASLTFNGSRLPA